MLLAFSVTDLMGQQKLASDTKPLCCAGKTNCSANIHTTANPMAAMCQRSCAVQNYDANELVSMSKAKVGDLTTCPVSGVVIRVTENNPRVSFADQSYYTCCTACARLFEADPEKFI